MSMCCNGEPQHHAYDAFGEDGSCAMCQLTAAQGEVERLNKLWRTLERTNASIDKSRCAVMAENEKMQALCDAAVAWNDVDLGSEGACGQLIWACERLGEAADAYLAAKGATDGD